MRIPREAVARRGRGDHRRVDQHGAGGGDGRAAAAFAAFCVDASLLARAKPSAIVLHCLPAHRGEEISSDCWTGRSPRPCDEAENRMHVQKALLEKLILG